MSALGTKQRSRAVGSGTNCDGSSHWPGIHAKSFPYQETMFLLQRLVMRAV